MAQPTMKQEIEALKKRLDKLTKALNEQYNELQDRIAEETGNGPVPHCWRALRISPVGGIFPFRARPEHTDADDCPTEAEAVAYAKEQGQRFENEVFTVIPVYHYQEGDEVPTKQAKGGR
ncbi:MAG: hypothetical protein D6706_21520 [Chloroflexi bacterium]|nr:MAG: hypothetical protein D6706_21520 [Chloroflexota bacterium]